MLKPAVFCITICIITAFIVTSLFIVLFITMVTTYHIQCIICKSWNKENLWILWVIVLTLFKCLLNVNTLQLFLWLYLSCTTWSYEDLYSGTVIYTKLYSNIVTVNKQAPWYVLVTTNIFLIKITKVKYDSVVTVFLNWHLITENPQFHQILV